MLARIEVEGSEERRGRLEWWEEEPAVGGERAWWCGGVPEPIQSPSGTGRRTEALDGGEAAAARREGLVACCPVEDVRGGIALGDWRKTLLELALEGVGILLLGVGA